MNYRAMRDERKDVDIILTVDELVRSVEVEGELIAESIVSDDAHARNIYRDIVADDIKREKVIRCMKLAMDELNDKLFPYSKRVIRYPQIVVSDMVSQKEIFRLVLNVPMTMSETTVEYLRTLGHEYVVARVLEEWARTSMPDTLATRMAVVDDISNKISAAKDRRMRTVRRRLSTY